MAEWETECGMKNCEATCHQGINMIRYHILEQKVEKMNIFMARLCNAIKPCAGVVHAPRYRVSMPLHISRLRGRASASASLVSRGSIAMSRFPIVTEDDIDARRESVLKYDFKSFK